MQAAGYTAGVLGEDGPVYFNVGKDGYESFFVNPANEQPLNIPIAVLVNENTASAAEMLTAVLQEYQPRHDSRHPHLWQRGLSICAPAPFRRRTLYDYRQVCHPRLSGY